MDHFGSDDDLVEEVEFGIVGHTQTNFTVLYTFLRNMDCVSVNSADTPYVYRPERISRKRPLAFYELWLD